MLSGPLTGFIGEHSRTATTTTKDRPGPPTAGTGDRLVHGVAGTDTIVAPAHFPGMQFFRVSADRVAEPVDAVSVG